MERKGLTFDDVRYVLSRAAVARGVTDWMTRVLSVGEAFSATRDYALDHTPAQSPERDAALKAGDAVLALREPSDAFVETVGVLCGAGTYNADQNALATLWGLFGGECEHGRGEEACAACEAEGSVLNEIRPAIYRAVRATA